MKERRARPSSKPSADRDDGNDCTRDLCRNADCAYRWTCDDGDPGTIDACVHGTCQHTPVNCDDGEGDVDLADNGLFVALLGAEDGA